MSDSQRVAHRAPGTSEFTTTGTEKWFAQVGNAVCLYFDIESPGLVERVIAFLEAPSGPMKVCRVHCGWERPAKQLSGSRATRKLRIDFFLNLGQPGDLFGSLRLPSQVCLMS
jgi:hypothetical protein